MIGRILAAARLRRAARLYAKGRNDEALEALEAARSADPGLPQYRQYLGILELKRGRLDEAEEALALAEKEGGDPFALGLARGAAQMLRKKFEEARKRFEGALAAFPVAFEVGYHVGLARLLAGDEAGARAEFARLLGFDDEALFLRLKRLGSAKGRKA